MYIPSIKYICVRSLQSSIQNMNKVCVFLTEILWMARYNNYKLSFFNLQCFAHFTSSWSNIVYVLNWRGVWMSGKYWCKLDILVIKNNKKKVYDYNFSTNVCKTIYFNCFCLVENTQVWKTIALLQIIAIHWEIVASFLSLIRLTFFFQHYAT